jgi:hypothetical protein
VFRNCPTIAAPCYLALLPFLWWISFRPLAGLGQARRFTALVLRSLVVILIVLALAELQVVHRSDKLTVIYLLDQSLRIPVTKRRAMIEYVNVEVRKQRTWKEKAVRRSHD